MITRRLLAWLVLGAALLLPAGLVADSPWRLRPPLWIDRDDRDIPQPKERGESEIYPILYNTWLRHLSVEHKVGMTRNEPSLNVNAWDEVPDSTWFTNRIGRRVMTVDEIRKGPEGRPPEAGRWRISRIRDEGYTPKLDIVDPAGQVYILKFDLPDALERNSAAERISTLIMHAAGYNVPHNSIAYFRSGDLYLDEKSSYRDAIGQRRRLTPADLERALGKLKPTADGRYRGLASQFLPGLVLDSFRYTGMRKDDPNDIIPHELRRELRGLRVIAAWINHADTKDVNAKDVYVTGDAGRQYVRHYLIDFGSTIGSGDFVNGPFRVGHEYIFDGPAIGRSFITLGAWQRPWDVRGRIRFPEIGYFQAELFEPHRWKPNYPNLAFEQMDEGDAYWGAKIVTAFSDEAIRALVEEGQYSRKEASEYLEDVLERRRDAIGSYWLNRTTPLEEPRLAGTGTDLALIFRDLGVERGCAEPTERAYRAWAEDREGKALRVEASVNSGPRVSLPNLTSIASRLTRGSPDRYGRTPILRLLIQARRPAGDWAFPAEIIIGYEREDGDLRILGWSHAAQTRTARSE